MSSPSDVAENKPLEDTSCLSLSSAVQQELIKQAFSEYESARKHRKTYLADSIVNKISSLGGRFLKKNDQGDWEQVPISMAREKVSHAFRKKRELDGKKQRSAPGKRNK